MAVLLYPKNGEEFSVTTDFAARFADDVRRSRDEKTVQSWKMPDGYDERTATYPASVRLSWIGGADENLSLSEDAGFWRPARVTVVGTEEKDGVVTAEITNLLLGAEYFWRVGGGGEVRSFRTSPRGIRFLRIDRINNVRDPGGKKTADGRVVKQGMIIRGIQLEHQGDEAEELLPAGVGAMRGVVGVRTEIDLREGGAEPHARHLLGEDVGYRVIPFYDFYDVISDEGETALRDLFDALSDPGVYPVYIHCAAGADRTGAAIGYILAALGVSEEEIYTDFAVTAFSLIPDERIDWVGPSLYLKNDAVLRDRFGLSADHPELMRAHLRSIGIGDDRMAALRDLLTE
ncbi:MAG: tyrosine-protein phosphatase [Clostridia bacterium]|nr:tyrosine-protein phosphatase [Clostridia bacterium]